MYFGARFYDLKGSIWLSVDPLADKYPNTSDYMYCGGNPIKYIDPDGRSIITKDLYEKDSKIGALKNAQKVAALEAFVNTKSGRTELAKYSAKGDKIGNHTFTKDGKYHKKVSI